MNALQSWQKYWNFYQIAGLAEAAFTAETVRQFGRKRAGDMRYVTAAFDYATSCAAEIKHRADADMRAALNAARALPASAFKCDECGSTERDMGLSGIADPICCEVAL